MLGVALWTSTQEGEWGGGGGSLYFYGEHDLEDLKTTIELDCHSFVVSCQESDICIFITRTKYGD